MDILTTSLEALLQRATNPQNENVDKAAVEAFCALVNKENEGSHIAIRLLANKIHAHNEREALQTLGILDACMKKCGSSFQSEVGKFRFLNEMIKLVSPKYLGSQTPPLVRVKVLQLLQVWTEDYPKEVKIKEAYDMLKKQGVIVEVPPVQKPTENIVRSVKTNSIFDNDERSRLLQKLLQSKNPDDLQAANRLIKTMVKEDDKRAELVSKRVIELEAVHNNIRLLNEMLDSYRPGYSSQDELDLIKELYQSCERLRPNVFRLAAETQQNEDMLKEVLHANDELGQVFDKYTAIIIRGMVPPISSTTTTTTKTSSTTTTRLSDSESLLDLGSPNEPQTSALFHSLTVVNNNQNKIGTKSDELKPSNIDALCDIFSSPAMALPTTMTDTTTILKPTTILTQQKNSDNSTVQDMDKVNSKIKALEDLNVLSETLLKENLSSTAGGTSRGFNRSAEKIPMNLLSKQLADTQMANSKTTQLMGGDLASGLDLNFLLNKTDQKNLITTSSVTTIPSTTTATLTTSSITTSKSLNTNGDDCMVDISDDIDAKICLTDQDIISPTSLSSSSSSSLTVTNTTTTRNNETTTSLVDDKTITTTTTTASTTAATTKEIKIKPMTDLSVTLDSVKPSSIPPLTVLDEKNGITVILHFAKDKPRDDVQVIVVTTISKNTSPLTNYHFQAVVPKTCKIKLQAASGSELPAHNPFLPPSAITQIMLLANPLNEKVSLKFMISYTMDDDMCTDMGQVDNLPYI